MEKYYFVLAIFTNLATSKHLSSLAHPDASCYLTLSSSEFHRHGVQHSQRERSPYKLRVYQGSDLGVGKPVEIILTAPIGGPAFTGFVVRVLSVKNRELGPMGTFNPNSDENARIMTCWGRKNSVVTHKDMEPKVQVRLEWYPPREGEFVPIVTWFKSEEIFWLNEKPLSSRIIRISNGSHVASHRIPVQHRNTWTIDDFLAQRITVTSEDGKQTVRVQMTHVLFHFMALCLVIFVGIVASLVYWIGIERRTAKYLRRFERRNRENNNNIENV